MLVLVNGRRYLGKDANGNLNLEELRLPGIQRIEVVKGAGSALYGSDALGGVVNFITDEPTERGVTNTAHRSPPAPTTTTGWTTRSRGAAAGAG